MQVRSVDIRTDDATLAGQIAEPGTSIPGVLFVHGWAGSQDRDKDRARRLAQLGIVSLTFDLRGHGANADRQDTVTREQNLRDICAAYDRLAAHPQVDPASIALIGSSYGGYLAALVAGMRRVRWLALRVPALYRDEGWTMAKARFDRRDIDTYRRSRVLPADNMALAECARFRGDVLIVESEHDDLIPHTVIASYLASFVEARSLTYRVITGADHALSDQPSKLAYDQLLLGWMREMVFGAR